MKFTLRLLAGLILLQLAFAALDIPPLPLWRNVLGSLLLAAALLICTNKPTDPPL